MKNFLSRKLVVVGLSSLVIGIVGAAGVFAAIPDSNTGRITACRNKTTGSLKVIDAQNGATCNAIETMLSWWSTSATSTGPAVKTAVMNFIQDSSDPDFPRVYNPTLSRGVLAVKKLVANDPVNNPADARGYCLDLDFTVRYSNSLNAARYEALEPGTQALIDQACGPGFEAFIQPVAEEHIVFFTE